MDNHRRRLHLKCRICANSIKRNKTRVCAGDFAKNIEQIWRINILLDSPDVHPIYMCSRCRSKTNKADYLSGKYSVEDCVVWKPHNDGCELCSTVQRGRPTKKRKVDCKTGDEDCEGSETDSDTGVPSDHIERVYCIGMEDLEESFERVPEEDKVEMMKVLMKSKETKRAVLEMLAESENTVVFETSDMDLSLSSIPSEVLSNIVTHIFKGERDAIVKDTASFNQTYKDIKCMTEIHCDLWLSRRNPVIVAALNGLSCNVNTSTNFQNCLALEHLYNICGINAVLPFSFLTNLVLLTVSNSKLAVNLVSKVLPGGCYTTIRSWMDHLSSTPRRFPSGDCEVAIDNDQVVKKNWKVRVGQKSRVSIITSVCQAVVDRSDHLQKRPDLSPRNWRRPLVEEDLNALEEAIHFDPYTNESLRKENKQLLQKCLERVFKEQDVKGDGNCTDDIDEKVREIEKKKTTRVCPNCQTEMPKKKRKCVNPDCRVDLKSAEAQLTGDDVLGTALLTPVREYNTKRKITEVVFEEEGEAVTQKVVTRFQQFDVEWPQVPSGHSNDPVKISVSDPVFVNPATYKAVANVLRHVGHLARVTRYSPEGEADTREWLPVTMDGSPYSIAANLLQSTHICIECSQNNPGKPCKPLSQKEWENHVKDVHGGKQVPSALEFDWVVLRIGPLHVEMNMLKTFFAVNWDVSISELAREMGFASPSAQQYAKSASNHHHAQTFLKTMLEGTWCELLIPYVREKIEKGEKEREKQVVSVSDYIYKWLDNVKDPNYLFQVEMMWRYAGAFQLYHTGIRRNNAEYVQTGLLAFAPLFSWRPFTSKYQLIELQERCNRVLAPPDLQVYLAATESFSTSGHPSKGEGMDAQLEEVNKTSKVWEHGAMSAKEWLTIMRNHDDLNKLRGRLFSLLDMSDPKDESKDSRRRDDLSNEVLAWRVRLRQERYLMNPLKKSSHVSLGGKPLDSELVKISTIGETNRKTVLKEVMIGKKKRNALPMKVVHVLASDRVAANQITKQTKDAILAKIEERVNSIIDVNAREPFQSQYKNLKTKKNSTLKESLICFLNEVTDSATQLNILATYSDREDDE